MQCFVKMVQNLVIAINKIVLMNIKKKRIALLGSTGSIGTQTLKVISAFPNMFEVEVLTANNNCSLLIEQAKKTWRSRR